jgi:hypothetical protein
LEDLLHNVAQEHINTGGKKGKTGIKASLSESKDNEEDEEMSVATSAFGRRALEDLLQNVAQEEKS